MLLHPGIRERYASDLNTGDLPFRKLKWQILFFLIQKGRKEDY